MQVLILYHNKNHADFIQRGLFYENIGSKMFEIPKDKSLSCKHFSQDAFLILSTNVINDLLLVRNIREYKTITPIAILAENVDDDFEIKAKEAGCDLVFVQPFSSFQMALQIKYLVYSNTYSRSKILKSGFLRLDICRRVLYKHGTIVTLRNKEFSLLEFLMLNPNRVLSRTEIFENVWDRNERISTNTVDVHISSLRKKIDDNSDGSFIQTVNCVGYLFNSTPKKLN